MDQLNPAMRSATPSMKFCKVSKMNGKNISKERNMTNIFGTKVRVIS